VLALIATHPRIALVVLAYTYLCSAFIGLAYSKLRARPHESQAVDHPSPSVDNASARDLP
jgi:hypothetical protein